MKYRNHLKYHGDFALYYPVQFGTWKLFGYLCGQMLICLACIFVLWLGWVDGPNNTSVRNSEVDKWIGTILIFGCVFMFEMLFYLMCFRKCKSAWDFLKQYFRQTIVGYNAVYDPQSVDGGGGEFKPKPLSRLALTTDMENSEYPTVTIPFGGLFNRPRIFGKPWSELVKIKLCDVEFRICHPYNMYVELSEKDGIVTLPLKTYFDIYNIIIKSTERGPNTNAFPSGMVSLVFEFQHDATVKAESKLELAKTVLFEAITEKFEKTNRFKNQKEAQEYKHWLIGEVSILFAEKKDEDKLKILNSLCYEYKKRPVLHVKF